jgi:hypothetical protein
LLLALAREIEFLDELVEELHHFVDVGRVGHY